MRSDHRAVLVALVVTAAAASYLLVVVVALCRRLELSAEERGHAERQRLGAEARWDAFTGHHPLQRLEGRRLADLLRPADRGALAGRADLLLAVSDTGIGTTAEQRARLFRPSSQADSSIARHFGGIRLGLAISRHLVELMGGSIWVGSEHGFGSTFSFRIPLPAAHPEAGSDLTDVVPSTWSTDPTY